MSDNKFNDQHSPDMVPTITEKSSGLDYVSASVDPSPGKLAAVHQPNTPAAPAGRT